MNLTYASTTSDELTNYITNGGFNSEEECFQTVWKYDNANGDLAKYSYNSNSSNVKEGSGSLNLWLDNSTGSTITQDTTLSQTITEVPAGTYQISAQIMGEGIEAYVYSSSNTATTVSGSAVSVSNWGTWVETSQTITISETTTDFTVGLALSGTPGAYCFIDSFTMTPVNAYEITVPNGNFESGTTNWTEDFSNITSSSFAHMVKDNSSSSINPSHVYNIWNGLTNTVSFSMSTTISGLAQGSYKASIQSDGEGSTDTPMSSGLSLIASSDSSTSSQEILTYGWDNYTTTETGYITVGESQEVTLTIAGNVSANGYWINLDNVKLYKLDTSNPNANENSTAVDATITVDKIDNLSEDFIRGVDISSLCSLEDSGVTFKDSNGNVQDIFTLLKDAGVNYIRVRVWNDPYDSNGNGYGGGNSDINTAIELGKRATEAGMKLLVDFHYSDFWADPSRQLTPKAWANYTVDQKAQAINDYTYDCLQQLMKANVDVGMVQIGNETNNELCDVSDWTDRCKLFKAGSEAVRKISTDYQQEIQVALHFTDPNDPSKYNYIAKTLQENNVDYDVFGFSYYPCWHGDINTITTALQTIATTYDKQVMVAETSYPYTLEDTDGWDNTIQKSSALIDGYTASVQGQANELRDVMAAVASVGEKGLGVFYWEPAWITVSSTNTYEENMALWEQYGSGWATSYATSYDPDNVGAWYGGSPVDNQCLFDENGVALDSLNTFSYVYTGSKAPRAIYEYSAPVISTNMGTTITWPQTITAVYNDRTQAELHVEWNASEIAHLESICSSNDDSLAGTYTVSGITSDGDMVTLTVNLLNYNYVLNYSFEDEDRSMWHITETGASNQTDYQYKSSDAKTGNYSLHYWSSDEVNFTCEQTITNLPSGYYNFSACIQGGDAGDSPDIYLYVITGGETYTKSTTVNGWVNWSNDRVENIPITSGEATIGIAVNCAANAWGTIDDFSLTKIFKATSDDDSSSGGSPSDGSPSDGTSDGSSSGNTTPSDSTTNTSPDSGSDKTDSTSDAPSDAMIQEYFNSISYEISKDVLYVGGTTGKHAQITINYPETSQVSKLLNSDTLKVTYSSSNPKVVMVSKAGSLGAKSAGSANITVTISYGNLAKQFTQTVTVKKAYIELVHTTKTMSLGDTFKFKAIGHGIDTNDIKWKTSKKKIVVIKKGSNLAIAKTTGTDIVTAYTKNIKTSITVTVKK